jgi:hypothetical protein
LRQLLNDGRASFSSATVDRLIAIADQDNDKQLNFNEFERMVYQRYFIFDKFLFDEE